MEENKDNLESGLDSAASSYQNTGKKELTPEQKLEKERRALGPTNYNRSVRRNQLRRAGILKLKNHLIFGSDDWEAWYEKTKKEGKRLFEENAEAVRKQQGWYLERKDESKREFLIKHYTEIGFSAEEVKAKVEEEMSKWYDSLFGKEKNVN
jgi:hypothetical protein